MASSDVGTITVYLKAISKQFDEALKRSAANVDSFNKRASRLTQGVSTKWTSMQSKVGMVTGGIEAGFKAGSTAIALFEGDLDTAVETLKTMPMGIGPVVSSMEEFYKAISGMGAALEKQQKTIQRNLRETALLAEVVAQKQQAIALGETFAGSTVEGDALREQQWRQSGRGIGFDRMQAQAALLAEFSEAERAIIDQINELEGNPSAWDDRLAELQESLDGRMADLDAYFDGLERLADVERELVSSARERAELTAAAAHDMHLLSLEGATAAEVDERRLQHYADLMASLEAHHAELVRIGATAEQIAEAEREMAAATVQSTRALEVRLAELQRTQGDLDGDPGAVAATFRTAVGTVSLPSAAETANLQREHIREQQATRLAIEAVEQAILQIASTHP